MLIILTYLSTILSFGQSGIISGPEDQILAVGRVAVFNCHARGDTVYWLIDGQNPHRSEAEYNERGFNFSVQFDRHQNGLDEYNNTIQVKADPSNNSTRISCIVYIYRQPEITQEATLIIVGPPLVPTLDYNHMLLINNTVVHTLSWDAPFTWPNFPITGYAVNITSYSDNVASLTTIQGNDSHIIRQFMSHGDSCYDIVITVAALNSIGDGEPAVLSVGHPIIMEHIEEIETTITFTPNGTPHFWMSFVIPNVCTGYQSGVYNITIYNFGHHVFHHFGPTQFTATEENDNNVIIVKEIKTGLVQGQNYSVEVSTESVGISRSKEMMFSTLFAGCHHLIENDNTGSVGAALPQVHVTSESCVIASSTVGGVVLTTLVLALVVLIVVKILRRSVKKKLLKNVFNSEHQRNICVPTNLKIQASNPVYEGAIYETTPGESVKSLLDSTSSSNTPSTGQNFRYTLNFDAAPKLPAPRKPSDMESRESNHDLPLASLKPAELSTSKYGSLSADEYMAMSTVMSNKISGLPECDIP